MTAGSQSLRWTIAVAATIGLGVTAFAMLGQLEAAHSGPTVGERLTRLRAERAGLQASADDEPRLGLLVPMRIDGLLTDALLARAARWRAHRRVALASTTAGLCRARGAERRVA